MKAQLKGEPLGAIFQNPYWILTDDPASLLEAEKLEQAIFSTDLEKVAVLVNQKQDLAPGMVQAIVQLDCNRVQVLENPAFETLELAKEYAQKHPGEQVYFLTNKITKDKITQDRIQYYGSGQQILDGKFVYDRISYGRPVGIIKYDPELLKTENRRKSRERSQKKYRAKVKIEQALIPPHYLKGLLIGFARVLIAPGLKISFGWNHTITREELISEINKLIVLCKKLKPPVILGDCGYRGYEHDYSFLISYLNKQFLSGLLKHPNPEYQKFGKWVQTEARKLKTDGNVEQRQTSG